MRDAFLITVTIIFVSVVLGVIYNLMKPYLVKLEVLEDGVGTQRVQNDGGVFRSADSGHSWSEAGAVEDKENFSRSDVFGFEFNMQDPDVLYAATSKGAYVSENSGEEWRPFSNGDLARGASVLAFAVDPKSPWRMYAVIQGDDRGKIVKSNGGDFYEVYSTLEVGDRVEGIWIDPVETSQLYATTAAGLFLTSEDFGESWKVREEFQGAVRSLLILRGNTRVIYALVGAGKIFKTSNRGTSWQDISGALGRHDDGFRAHSIARDPNNENRLYLATSAGLFKSEDGSASFVQVPLLTAASSFSIGAVTGDPKVSGVIYMGVASQIHKSTDGGKNWQIKTLATSRAIRAIAVKPDDSAVIFAGVQHD